MGSEPLPNLLRQRDRRWVIPGFTDVQASWLSLIYSSLILIGFGNRNGRFCLQRAGMAGGGGRGDSQAQLPTLHGPKVLVRDGGEGRRLSSLLFTGEQTEA